MVTTFTITTSSTHNTHTVTATNTTVFHWYHFFISPTEWGNLLPTKCVPSRLGSERVPDQGEYYFPSKITVVAEWVYNAPQRDGSQVY